MRTLAAVHCAGGIILGYQQVSATVAKDKDGRRIRPYSAPTPWNNLETGILFGLGLPLLVLKEKHISGGIFDAEAGDLLIQEIPQPPLGWSPGEATDSDELLRFEQVVQRWQALVQAHYYDDDRRRAR